jgi:CheY-like chemotaxis protein
LIREGWVVLTASDPAEGLQSYEAHWRGIALVLLDYYMPGLRGDEVWERLKRINPQVRVLLMTASDDYLPPRVAQRRSLRFHPKTGHAQGTASADPRGLESPRSAGPFV